MLLIEKIECSSEKKVKKNPASSGIQLVECKEHVAHIF